MAATQNTDETAIFQIEKLTELSLEKCRSNPEAGIKIAEEILSISNSNNCASGLAKGLACKGACLVWIANYDKALEALFESLPKLQGIGDKKFEAHALYHIFCTYYFLADYDNALKYAHEMLRIATQNKDLSSQANAYNAIGSICYTTNENQKALEALLNGLTIANTLDDKHLIARILDGIGTSHFNLNEMEKSIEFKKKALEVSRSIGSKQVESYAIDGLAKTYLAADDLSNAEKYLHECLSIRQELNFKSGVAETNFQLGDLYLKMNRLDYALSHLITALKIAEETNTKEVAYKAHKSLYTLYEKQGNTTKFIEHFKNYYTLKEEFFSEKNKQKLKDAEMQISISRMEKEKELLNEKNKQLESLSNDLVTLSNLGKTITSLLSIEAVNKTAYNIINNMMDAHGFGIGIVDDDKSFLNFPGYIEKDIVLSSSGYDLTDENRLASVCFNKELEIVINDYDLEVEKYIQKRLQPVVGESVQSIIYLPLKLGEKKLGVLTVQSFNKNAFDDYKVNLVKNLAVYCAIAIENATLYQKSEERVEERTRELLTAQETTRMLSVIGKEIISTTDFNSIFNKLHQKVGQLMNADCFGVRIYYPKLNQIEYRYEIENGELFEPLSVSMDNDDNYSVWCVKNKKEIFINDNLNEYQKYTKKIVVPTGNMSSSLLFCPMMIGEMVVGVITVQSFKTNAYLPLHMDILKTLATYTAIAIENANLVENLEEKVEKRTKEVVKQKEIIEEANKHITDSIKYAKKIQQALLKNETHESKHLPDHFILFEPKDIISGDFYWALEKNNHLYLAAADCTGHGVPGALLTMLGTSFLNEINACEALLTPSEILDQLRKRFIKELNQTGMSGENKDGMDISLIRIKLTEKSSDNQSYSTELMWAGANNPLYLISKTNEILQTIGDDKTRLIKNNTVITAVLPTKQPIGYYSNMSPFKNHTLALNKGDYACLFTDGYADQFGGPKGKKYKYKALKEKLLSIWELPMEEQKHQLLSEFSRWKGTLEQVDDVCIIGLRV